MELKTSRACKPCITRFIGPALHEVGKAVATPRSPEGKPVGCCSEEGQRYEFTYWYPWEEVK